MKFIIHENPVRRSDGNYIARIDLAPFGFDGEVEQVWLKRLTDEQFSLCCIPFRAYGVSLDDIVELSADRVTVSRVARMSGRRSLRILFLPSSDLPAVLDRVRGEISRLGLMSEWSGDRHVAIDVPPGVDVAGVLQIAEREESASRGYWEWSDTAPFSRA